MLSSAEAQLGSLRDERAPGAQGGLYQHKSHAAARVWTVLYRKGAAITHSQTLRVRC